MMAILSPESQQPPVWSFVCARQLRRTTSMGAYLQWDRRRRVDRIADCHCRSHTKLNPLLCMAGTTGLEPATSAVTGQRSNQLSYVPRLLFNNLDICHIESSVLQNSQFSLFSTLSLLWTQFRASIDTK